MTQADKNAVWQGTLSLMVMRTLLTMGEQHAYGIAGLARRDVPQHGVQIVRIGIHRPHRRRVKEIGKHALEGLAVVRDEVEMEPGLV